MQVNINQEIKHKLQTYKQYRKIKALKVDIKKTNIYHKGLKSLNKVIDILCMDRIIDCPPNHKLILVSDDCKQEDLGFGNKQQWSFCEHEIQITHKNCTTQQLFNIFQPQNMEKVPFPNSFQTIGHIAHYNLTPQQTKYKEVIGQITLLKCLGIKTVVHKTQKLHNVYRTPTLQPMAGPQDYVVRMKEVGVSFQLDFQKVYWCSRLQKERDRVLGMIKPGQLLADIFCGVGPLAVRAAKKGAFVIANDLNPQCFRYLDINCILNKVQKRVLRWNMCAREAMKKLYAQKLQLDVQMRQPDHVYMNLPVDAIQFLDVFVDYSKKLSTNKMPLIHVNCFVVADTDQLSKQLLQKRIRKILPAFKKQDIVALHHIKNVTIMMRMYCVSFRLNDAKGEDLNQGNNNVDIVKTVNKDDEEVVDSVKKKIKVNDE